MTFRDSIVAGVNLVRNAIRSPNYITGISGWTINRDGSAEFNNVTVRGVIVVGPNPGQHIVIDSSSGIPRIGLYSGDPQEVFPAYIANFQNGGVSWFEIDTSDDGFGINQIIGVAPQAATPGGWLFATTETTPGAELPKVEVDVDMQLRVSNTNNTSLTSVNHGFQIGPDNSFNVAFGDAQIQARNNGVQAVLNLNDSGGNIQAGILGGTGTLVAANNNTNALGTTNNGFMIGDETLYNLIGDVQGLQARHTGAAAALMLNPQGGDVGVFINGGGNNVVEVHGFVRADNVFSNQGFAAGPFGPNASIVFVNGTGFAMTGPYPTSGKIWVGINALISMPAGGAVLATGVVTVQIRTTNAAGAITFAASNSACARLQWNPGDPAKTKEQRSNWFLVTGLPTTGTYYAEVQYRTTVAATPITIENVNLTISPAF